MAGEVGIFRTSAAKCGRLMGVRWPRCGPIGHSSARDRWRHLLAGGGLARVSGPDRLRAVRLGDDDERVRARPRFRLVGLWVEHPSVAVIALRVRGAQFASTALGLRNWRRCVIQKTSSALSL